MSAINFTLNFGSGNNGLALNARLLDASGATVGSLITTGFVDLGDGIYSYQHTSIPNNHRGTFKAWVPANPGLGSIGVAVNPEDAEDVSDILFYVQSLINAQAAASVAANTSVTLASTSNPTGEYILEPAGFRMVTASELLAELKTLVQEPALKAVHAEAAIKSAIEEDDHRPMVALTYYQALTKEECDYPAPCSGARVVSVEVLPTCYCDDDCYIPVWFQQDKNRIHLNISLDGTAKITTAFGNRLISNKLTVALAAETSTEGLWQIYIEGQPELPGSGVIRICGDPWVYAYKSGTTFASATIDSADSFDSADGLPPPAETEDEFEVVVLGESATATSTASYGAPAPDGKHTCLYARRVANCNRLADSELVKEMAGATVEWPLVFVSGAYREYIMALATSKAYAYLINSSRSDRDVQRFAQLQTHWENQAARLHSKIPKFRPGAARRQFLNDSFSTHPLRTGRLATHDGGLSGIRLLW